MRKAPRLSAPSRSLTAGSFTITNSQFCALLPVGALSASSITRSTSPSSTGSGLSRRIARWVRIASSSGIEKRSEEHTSELQSHVNLVCRLLLEKKKYDYETLTVDLQRIYFVRHALTYI